MAFVLLPLPALRYFSQSSQILLMCYDLHGRSKYYGLILAHGGTSNKVTAKIILFPHRRKPSRFFVSKRQF